MNELTLEVVIAHYKEQYNSSSLCTLMNFASNIIIYNKHEGSNLLPNVGHEAHTFLYHIIHNYHALYDVTLFLMGKWNIFCRNVVAADLLVKLRSSEYVGSKQFDSYGDHNITFTVDGCPHHPGLPIRRIWNELFLEECNVKFNIKARSMFHVTRDLILARSLDFYKKCYDLLLLSDSRYNPCGDKYNLIDPIEGYVFERLWPMIFNPEIKAKL